MHGEEDLAMQHCIVLICLSRVVLDHYQRKYNSTSRIIGKCHQDKYKRRLNESTKYQTQ